MIYLLTKVFTTVLLVSLAVPAVADEPDRDAEPIWLAVYHRLERQHGCTAPDWWRYGHGDY